MEVDTLVLEAEGIVQDATYDDTWFINKFNECLLLLATLCRIPGLQIPGSVAAVVGGKSVAMPKTFLHDLFLVTSPTYPRGLLIAPNIKELIANTLPDDTGPPAIIALDNRTLHYRPSPTEEEILTLYYYGNPAELAAGDSFPAYIPAILHKEIFLNYALKEAYMQIEDGLDGKSPNTDHYGNLAAAGIASLVAFYPNAPKAKPNLVRGGSFF